MTLRVLALVFATVAAPAVGETHLFSLYLGGLKAGTIQTQTEWAGSNFVTRAKVKPTGIIAKIAKFGYSSTLTGRKKGARLLPDIYHEIVETTTRKSQAKLQFRGDMPKVLSYEPMRKLKEPGPSDKGATDILTPIFTLFRDAPLDALCKKSFRMYDGRRTTAAKVEPPVVKDHQAICKGQYERISGFSERDLKKGSTFPFTLFYQKQDDGNFRLMSFSTKTTVGLAKAVRK